MKTQYVECVCNDPDHLIKFSYDEFDGNLEIQGRLNHYVSFYKRIVNAVKYVLKFENNCVYDVTLVDCVDYDKIRDMLNKSEVILTSASRDYMKESTTDGVQCIQSMKK